MVCISRSVFRGVLLLVAVLAVLVLWVSSAFGAAEPWWHLTAEPVPTFLHAGVARDEVQELKVNASGGDVLWDESFPKSEFVVFSYNATHEEVQGALETLYGAGGVEVTGGPREPGQAVVTEAEPYLIRFVGPKGGRAVPLPGGAEFTADACFANPSDRCLEGSASISEHTKGRADGEIFVSATNLGDADATGCSKVTPGTGKYTESECATEASPAGSGEYEKTPITLSEALPPGYEAVGVSGIAFEGIGVLERGVPCSLSGENGTSGPACSFAGNLHPYTTLTLHLLVDVTGSQEGEGVASVSGGGGRPVSRARPIPLGESTPFGVSDYELVNEDEGGGLDTQAGSHPFQQTTTIVMNQTLDNGTFIEPAALPKDLHFAWPAGLVGNAAVVPQCPLADFLNEKVGCPADTAVGVAKPLTTYNQGGGARTNDGVGAALYNLVPSPGEPARLGFLNFGISGLPIYIDPSVRSGRDYGITVNSGNITQLAGFRAVEVTVWGVPGDKSHDNARGYGCLSAAQGAPSVAFPCKPTAVGNAKAFLSLPTSCPVNPVTHQPESLVSTVTGDSWVDQRPIAGQSKLAEFVMPAVDGCDALPFDPSLSVAPDGQQGSTPTGLSVAIHVPQEETLAPGGLAEAAVKDTTVTLPEGVQISPAAADGLLACSTAQAGYTGLDPVSGAAQFTPGAVECADASKVATVEVKTPLLAEPLTGAVYLAAQDQNPFGSLVALYLQAENPREGVNVKLAGEVKLNERTGQITTTFPDSPNAPLEEVRIHFFGGNRAPLSTPPLCGSYTSTASIVPWSSNPPPGASSTFEVTGGPNGTPCQTPRPFQPGFQAGTTSVQAGGYTPLTLTMSRPDADQTLGKLSVVFPPGVSAGLRGVKLCEEPQAAQGACSAESQIGTVTASAGLAGDPFPVETGKAYITGPYEGDPFGVEIVVPAIAGPFNLGTEIVRAKVNVDPTDAHLTVVSDPFPTILDGIPLQLQHVNVLVNRPGFVFNPTSCEPMKLTGELESTEGATANVATPFQVTNCAALSFKPEFNVQTSAHTSRTEGASLHVTLTLPSGAQGTKANVAKVRVSLPKQSALAVENAAEGVHRKGLRGKPIELPEGVQGRRSDGRHPGPGRPPDGPGVLRLPRWREVPGTDHRAHRRGWRHRPGARRNLHQQTGDHHGDFRDGAGRAVLDVRTDAPQTGIPGADREREPLQGHADHAHRIRRPERAEDRPGNEDRGDRMPTHPPEERTRQAQEEGQAPEAREAVATRRSVAGHGCPRAHAPGGERRRADDHAKEP